MKPRNPQDMTDDELRSALRQQSPRGWAHPNILNELDQRQGVTATMCDYLNYLDDAQKGRAK